MSTEPAVGFRFRVQHAGGRAETLMVDAERALIGSAAHCEVRLDPEVAAHEHVEVYAHAGAVHFATRPYGLQSGPPVLDGVVSVQGTWSAGSTLLVGNVGLQVELVDIGMARAKPPFWMLLLIVPALVFAIAVVAIARAPALTGPFIPPAPALLPPRDTTACRNVGADQRGPLAAEKLRIGLAKRERSPFAPHDGTEAVLYLEVAAACYQGAGMTSDAASAEQAADALRIKLDEEYRLRRVRLEHAYEVNDILAMKRELLVLIPMLADQRGPYVEWLSAIDRAVTAKIKEKGQIV